MHPSLLFRLACHRTYLAGVGCQVIGFLLAFLARRELPLFLVQASVSAGLGVMALLGVVLLHWRLPRAEVALLGLLGAGVGSLVLSAKPGKAHHVGATGVMMLACALGAIGLLGVFAVRIHGAPGSVVLGSLAGLAFGAAAIDSRALAAAHSWQAFVLHPLLYLLFAYALLGQLLLGMAMQRGSTTAAVAAMDAASTVPAAVIGLAFLGDQIWPGRQWLAATGFTLTLAAVVGLSRFAQPQQAEPAYQGRHVAGRGVEPRVPDAAPRLPAMEPRVPAMESRLPAFDLIGRSIEPRLPAADMADTIIIDFARPPSAPPVPALPPPISGSHAGLRPHVPVNGVYGRTAG